MADATYEEFFNNGGGGPTPGDMALYQEAGTDFTESGAYWLRSGFVATAGSYPTAAAKERAKVTGVNITNLPNVAGFAATQIADNGAGTFVACYGDTTNVLVTTDNWATSSVVAHGLGMPAVAVVYTGSRFIIAGNTTTALTTRYSTNGTTWNAGGSVASTGVTADKIRGAWNGSVAFFVSVNNANAAFTTTDWVTLTQRTLPTMLQYAFIITGTGADSGTFLFGVTSSNQAYTSTNGVAYTAIASSTTWPTGTQSAGYVAGVWMLFGNSGGAYWASTDLVNWTARTFHTTFSVNTTMQWNFWQEAGRMYLGCREGVLWSSDGIKWFSRWALSTLPVGMAWLYYKNVMLPTPQNSGTTAKLVGLKVASFTAADWVGIPVPFASGYTSYYMRLS